MTIDVRKKESYTYQEAMDHLRRLLNTETFAKISKAIKSEIDAQRTEAVREELAHQEYSSNFT